MAASLVRLRHKFQNPAMARRLRAWRTGCFCRKSPHVLGLRLVCDAVVLIAPNLPLVATYLMEGYNCRKGDVM